MFIKINNKIVNTCLLQPFIHKLPGNKARIGLYEGDDIVCIKESENAKDAEKELDIALTYINNYNNTLTDKLPELFILS